MTREQARQAIEQARAHIREAYSILSSAGIHSADSSLQQVFSDLRAELTQVNNLSGETFGLLYGHELED